MHLQQVPKVPRISALFKHSNSRAWHCSECPTYIIPTPAHQITTTRLVHPKYNARLSTCSVNQRRRSRPLARRSSQSSVNVITSVTSTTTIRRQSEASFVRTWIWAVERARPSTIIIISLRTTITCHRQKWVVSMSQRRIDARRRHEETTITRSSVIIDHRHLTRRNSRTVASTTSFRWWWMEWNWSLLAKVSLPQQWIHLHVLQNFFFNNNKKTANSSNGNPQLVVKLEVNGIHFEGVLFPNGGSSPSASTTSRTPPTEPMESPAKNSSPANLADDHKMSHQPMLSS